MARPDWAPDDIDISVPSAARMYDYYLGGAHNFAADRELAEQALRAMPDGRQLARTNRAFLQRAVRYLVGAGVRRQFRLHGNDRHRGGDRPTVAASSSARDSGP
jgi:hypothetical protein